MKWQRVWYRSMLGSLNNINHYDFFPVISKHCMFGFVFRSTHARTHETKIQILNFLAAREEKNPETHFVYK